MPAKEISTALALHAEPNQWDLFDNGGRRATRNVHYGNSQGTGAHLTYVRTDLVERYIAETGKSLVVAVTCVAPAGPSNNGEPIRLGWVLRAPRGVEAGFPKAAGGTDNTSA